MNFKVNWDGLGIFTSVACAIHCAILPLIVTSLPLFGVNIIHNGYFEWVMIFIAFIVGGYSLFHGFLKHHRSFLPVILFTMGFILLLLKQVFHRLEVYFLIPAVGLIVIAHFYNYKLYTRMKSSSLH